MKISRFVVPAALALSCLSLNSREAHADLLFNNYTSEATSGLNANFNFGTEFTVGAQSLNIDALGIYDLNGDGLLYSHQVGVWRVSDQALIASTTVPSGTGTSLIQDWRFVNLSAPTVLAASTTYRIAALETNPADGNPNSGTFSLGSGIASATAGSIFSTGFVYPASTNSVARVFANASFSAIATPEPSTYAMMALGLVALCVLGAKRRKDGQAI